MKIKSLLVAGLAVLALNAMAEYKTCQSTLSFDVDIVKNAEIGVRTPYFPVHCVMVDNADDFTNLQFTFVMPEGLEGNNCRANDGTKAYNEDEDDTIQPLGWSCGMVVGRDHDFKCIGVNLTKTPIPQESFDLCDIRVTKTAELAAGSKIHVEEFKYTDYADNAYLADEFDIDLKIVNSAVDNINAGKAVAGVKYYNVAGVAADEAFDGVNIVVTTYADGTQNVVKVVK